MTKDELIAVIRDLLEVLDHVSVTPKQAEVRRRAYRLIGDRNAQDRS